MSNLYHHRKISPKSPSKILNNRLKQNERKNTYFNKKKVYEENNKIYKYLLGFICDKGCYSILLALY